MRVRGFARGVRLGRNRNVQFIGWENVMKKGTMAWVLLALAAVTPFLWTSSAGSARTQEENLVTNLANPLPGMPPVLDAHDIYSADRPGDWKAPP